MNESYPDTASTAEPGESLPVFEYSSPGIRPYFNGLITFGGMSPYEAQRYIQSLPPGVADEIARHPSPDYPW